MATQTLEAVIAEVLELLDRPDLLATARKRVRNVLKSCHASADFHRDISSTTPVAVVSTQSTSIISLPDNWRKLYEVMGYGQDGSPLATPYTMQKVLAPKSYFGFTEITSTYSLRAGSLHLVHADLPIPATVSAFYFKYPSFTVSTSTETLDEVTTDSWMLENYAEAIVQGLLLELAKSIEHKVYLQSASQLYPQLLAQIADSELVEIP